MTVQLIRTSISVMVMLYLIGLGLDDREITEKGREALGTADRAFAEFYTNTASIDIERLEEETGTEIERLSREEVEQQEKISAALEDGDVAFLVSGDPLTATTHYDIKHRAEEKGEKVEVIHAPSILTSVAETGLNVYKFGRVVTLPESSRPSSVTDHIADNDSIGLHTLVLLDIDYRADEAAEKLVDMGVDPGREAVVIERANHSSQWINVGRLEDMADADLGRTPHSIVLVGEMDHKEQEFLEGHR
ncbi:MAG: diphthine synthase [Candidatus Nanohaloarchaea archaeon]